MKFSKTTEYSIRILTFMAREKDKIYSARFPNEKLGIPYKYLTNLLKKLANFGFIKSIRGKYGGYKIIKDLNEISVYQIIGAIEGYEVFTRCILGFDKCDENNPCLMHKEWSKIRDLLIIEFKKMTLLKLKEFGNCKK